MTAATQKKVLANTLAQFAGKILSIGASFVVVKLVSQFGPEFYGNYVTTYEFLAFFGIIADAGLFAIAVREMSRDRERSEFVLGNILSLRLILVLAVMLLAGLTAQLVPTYAPEVKIGIWITAISMGLTIVAGTLSSVLQARMKIQYFAGSMVAAKILLAALIWLICRQFDVGHHPLLPLLWAGVISNIIFAGLIAWFTSREVRIRLRWNSEFLKKTLRVSLPYGLALILQTLYLRLDIVLISLILGAAAVGTYGVATRVLESLMVLGVYFGQAMLPKISAEEHDGEQVGRSLVWGIEKLLVVALPLVIGVEAFAPNVVKILSSGEFISTPRHLGSDTILQLLVPTVAFAFLNQLFTFTLVAKNRQNYLLVVNATALGLNAALNLFFIPRFGIIAAAASTVLCEVVVFALLSREISQKFTLQWSLPRLGRIVLANLVLAGLIFLTPLRTHLLMATAVGGAAYIVLVWPQFRDLDSIEKS